MDKTYYCRDKCASSADMLTCMQDCMTRSASPSKSRSYAPKMLLTGDNKKVAIIGGVIIIAAIAGFLLFKKKTYQ